MRYREAFKQKKRVFLPVIHVDSEEQAVENAKIAFESRADGLYLVSHIHDVSQFMEIFDKVAEAHPGKWVGLNFGPRFGAVDPLDWIRHKRVDGIWLNHAQIGDATVGSDMARLLLQRSSVPHPFVLFGGVAYKLQPTPEHLDLTVANATRFVDVIVTSGDEVGVPPSFEKMRIIREAAGDHPVAIAGGLTPDNIEDFLPYADCFMVATGIYRSFHYFDPAKVRAIAHLLKD